ncbi:MAG: FkbM family methyltransferase [Planctomycetota bacterium]
MRIEHFRPGTTDDRYVIPELIDKDMYRIRHLADLIEPYPGDLIDGGAQIGVFTCLLAENTDRTIHSFEPTSANFPYLEKNTERFGDRVQRHKQALALHAGTLRMTEQEGNEGNFFSSPDGEGEEVEAISLPDFIRGLGHVALLKLDLEGAEAAILNETEEEDLTRVGVLVIEEHDRPIDHRRLKRIGFSIDFRPGGRKRHAVYVYRGRSWWRF